MTQPIEREATSEELGAFLLLQSLTRSGARRHEFNGRWITCHVINMTKISFIFRFRGSGWSVLYRNSAFSDNLITLTGSEEKYHRDLIAFMMSRE